MLHEKSDVRVAQESAVERTETPEERARRENLRLSLYLSMLAEQVREGVVKSLEVSWSGGDFRAYVEKADDSG